MYKTYVMHYTKLPERKKHIENQLQSASIEDYEFIEEYDKEQLTKGDLADYYDDSKFNFDKVAQITLNKTGETQSCYKELSLASISLNIKHIVALRKFLEADEDFALMIEDDCLFREGDTAIRRLLNRAPLNWDVIFPGGAFGHEIIRVKSAHKDNQFLLAEHPATNTTSSMIFNKDSAEKMLDSCFPFSLPWDWQLNYVFAQNDFDVYHSNPYICTQISNKVQGFDSTA